MTHEQEIMTQRLNILTLPLFSERLIEASAGTGKTFTIIIIYLRLLLGLGGGAAFFRVLTVQEILVVTFTEIATEVLRGRIRKNIQELRLAIIRRKSQEPLFSEILNEIDDFSVANTQLLSAERQIDEAAIYTIHGFCQQMLIYHAFESSVPFEQKLLQDQLPLHRLACADFWRRHCYPLPLDIARIINQEWHGPDDLLADIARYLNGEAPTLRQTPHDQETILIRHKQIVTHIDAVKLYWRSFTDNLDALIRQSDIDKRSYSRKYLPRWLAIVNDWAAQETLNYQLPRELNKFRQSVLLKKTKHGKAPIHALFSAIDELFAVTLTLRDLIVARAIKEIRYSIQRHKSQRAELSFDDLLSGMETALQKSGGGKLAKSIRNCYPAALIDEFQDTDPQQYRIFQKIYVGQPYCVLLLIGDPKQAIYSFRGADIFTYMRARREISAQYTLETNWRSSPAMIASVNLLFRQVENPFLFSQIPFIEISAAEKNQGMVFELNNKSQPAMQFWLQKGEYVSLSNYQELMSRQCASQIRDWLNASQEGHAWLNNGKCRRLVQASDITVLVRCRNEAALVRDALSALAIPSVYLSNRESVFHTVDAKELLWLLQAILMPEQEGAMRRALASGLMGLDAPTLSLLISDDLCWNELVEEFDQYHILWRQYGVLTMLNEVIKARHLAENLLASHDGKRRLTNILHLSELLQEVATQLDSAQALVRWLSKQITQSNSQCDKYQLRLDSDRHLVRVITIHKSKGLELDLVWLPFLCNFRVQQEAFYHDRQTFQPLLDINGNDDSLAWAEEERLSEDLRLLYVALTRSIYHSSIGIAPIIRGVRKNQSVIDIHRSALGYLVLAGKAGNAAYLHERLQQLASSRVALSMAGMLNDQPLKTPIHTPPKVLAKKYFTRLVHDFWRVTSYTGLRQHSVNLIGRELPYLGIGAMSTEEEKEEPVLTMHTFPRGIVTGTFLHSLLENLDFTRPLDEKWPSKQLKEYNYADHWQPVLLAWARVLLATSLNDQGMTLASLSSNHKQTEFQFYLPINGLLQAQDLNKLVKQYDPLSATCPELYFERIQGMLKGFIDLVFCWHSKYYLLDYKSNWLGKNSSAYGQSDMARSMKEHRYDLQYQLYALALHRYLRHRLRAYDYHRHFGGVIYLFLRGVDTLHPGNGIFSCLPQQQLVEEIDYLFNGDVNAGKHK